MATVTEHQPRPIASPRALVVDDEPDIRELLGITLGRMNIEVKTAGDYASAIRALGGERFDLVLTDMRLPDGDGLDLVEWIQANRPGLPVAVITAHGNVEAAVRALKLGAFDFVSPTDGVDHKHSDKTTSTSKTQLTCGTEGETGELGIHGCAIFAVPILLALMLNEVRSERSKRFVQTSIYLPHFVSWVIFGSIVIQFLSPSTGIVNALLKALKGVAPAVLRCGATKGQSTLLAYDRAIVDFPHAYNLKQSRSIYVVTQWKENLAPMTTMPRASSARNGSGCLSAAWCRCGPR